jgi:predicted phage terminase large subunit-like protein
MTQPWTLAEESLAALKVLRRKAARSRLIDFCRFVDPAYSAAPHLVHLSEKLQEVERYVDTNGQAGVGRLLVNMPPRHGKSETASKRFPAFVLGRHPDWHIGLVAYNDGFAEDFSRANRELIGTSPEYRALFPESGIHPASGAVSRWSLANGDIDNPNLVATGIGGSLTGRGFQVLIIDDPVKNRAEAESKTYREHLHNAYKGTLRTRLEPGGAVIIICTRWHEDDLPGWLLLQHDQGEGEPWTVVNFPAIAEEHDVLGRGPGQALWPERFSPQVLAATRLAIGSYEFEAQYQQHPKPPEGGKIRRDWFNVIDQLPARFQPGPKGEPPAERLYWYRYWDLAATARTTSDYTASCRLAFDKDGNLYIADMLRQRIEWPEQEKLLKLTMLSERSLGVRHGIEKAIHGIAAVQTFMRDRDLVGVAFAGIDVSSDKLTRALPWVGRAEAGRVYLIAGPWVGAFLDEAANFTGHNDAHDDQIDAVSGGVAMADTPDLAILDFYARRFAEQQAPAQAQSTR